jgi:hypothetical protein
MENKIKIIKDGFVWLVVTEKAKEVFQSGLFELYVVREDESECIIRTYEDLATALNSGNYICIEVGWLPRAEIEWLPANE